MSAQWYRWDGADLLLQVKLQPRASRDEFADVQQDRLRIRITAPPIEGKANAHLLKWVARQFGVARSAVTLEQGQTNRLKRLRVASPKRLPLAIDDARR